MTTSIVDKIGGDYKLDPQELFDILTILVKTRQPAMVWGPPGVGKSDVARQIAAALGAIYIDVRALLLDPVDLRGIPWRDTQDGFDVTRWAPPSFLPPESSDKLYLINLEELPSAPPMVQAALYQLVLDRACGEYRLPEGAALIACGNRESDKGVTHRMPTPLASRFVHLEVKVSLSQWLNWAVSHELCWEVISFVRFRSELLHQFNPSSEEVAFPCPRTWEFVSNILKANPDMPIEAERPLFRGAVGEGAAMEFISFLQVCRDLPDPEAVLLDPSNAMIPREISAQIALCGSLHRLADDTNMDAICTYSDRLREEIGAFLVGSCVKRNTDLQHTLAWVNWISTHNN